MVCRRMVVVWAMLIMVTGLSPVWAGEVGCQPPEIKKIKVEGFISKKFRKNRRQIIKEFSEIGNVRASLRVFPMGDTAKVVAVGRCVPAYIGRHVLQKSLQYTGGIESLVNQSFLHPNWVGIGTTMFDEPSQQKVTEEQVRRLLDPELNDEQFQALYREFSVQDDKVHYFGLDRPNAKIPDTVGETYDAP